MTMDKDRKEQSKLSKEEWREYTKTVWHIANTSDPHHPAVFAPEVPTRLIKMYSFVGEKVLDPFAGVGTTARAAATLGRRSVCVEQNERYAKRIVEETAEVDLDVSVEVVVGDARRMDFLESDSIDLIVTSPPYWNKADYGGNGSNVGNIEGYADFFSGIRPVFEECLRVLKPGRKLCVVTANVNQHTDYGLLTFPLAADFIILMRDLGSPLVSEAIWSKDKTGGKWGSYGQQRPIFGSYPYPPNFMFKTVHEHILVFLKPPTKKVRGPKVVAYDQLMDPTPKTVEVKAKAPTRRSAQPASDKGKPAQRATPTRRKK